MAVGSYSLRRATYAVASQQRKGVASQWELPLLWQIMSRLEPPETCSVTASAQKNRLASLFRGIRPKKRGWVNTVGFL